MGKLLVLCVAILACIGIGSALQCLKCSFTVFDIPCHTSTVTCEEGQVCATIHGRAAGHKLIKKRNCVDQQKCNQNETASFLGVSYVTTFNCCEGDFCNSAATVPSAQLSLPMALAMLGVWLTRFL
ncbi:sperm acrosome membrane-associated protein 4-like [Hemicordylus capensis]|uniref:sperm acrosome membrane-associated protein 4-like n=1 Tax=Hemicordylus capensis TaxID=884348 RepID=UPI002304CC11|nr:sperm acrosome membrane-associated protein 4-like [Hemicordylus capensis]